jgi:type VI secretion system protein ImpM
LPGWFGKLPGMGDFAHRRLPDRFRDDWDRWLQDGLAQLRVRHEDWVARYLDGPVWCFALAEGVLGARAWIGVLMPSVDGVGRYFPFMVARPLDAPIGLCGWWALAAQAGLDGLEADADAEGFEALLHRAFAQDAVAPREHGDIALPPAGCSLWLTAPGSGEGQRLTVEGLPRGACFDALFGFPQRLA